VAIDHGACEAISGELDAKRVGSTTSTFASLACFVLPVLLSKEGDIDPPDNYRFPGFDNLRGVY
jgi:hypothetical protein